jgi:hypothetical protein
MIMSVSTLIILIGAATPSKTVNLSMVVSIPWSKNSSAANPLSESQLLS